MVIYQNNKYQIVVEDNDRDSQDVFIVNTDVDEVGSLSMLDNEGEFMDGTPCPQWIIDRAYSLIDSRNINY